MARVRTLIGISVFWVGLSMLGDGFTTLVLPLRLTGISDPASIATLVGVVTFLGIGAGMLVQPVAGALSDQFRGRWGRRGIVATGVALVIVALALFLAAPTLLGILVAFVAVQVALNIAQAAQQGLIPDLVERPWRGRAAGLKGFADLAGAFIAFVLLAIVLGTGGVTTATVAIGGVVVLTALLATALVREPSGSGRPALTANRLNLRAAFGLDRAAHREFVAVVAARFLFLFGTFAVGRFFLLIVADRLALEPAAAGEEAATILAILALVTAVAALPAGLLTDRIGRVSMMAIGGLVTSAGVLLLLVASSSFEFVVYGSLMAAGSAMFVTANWAMTTDLVPRGEAARFMGIANFGTAGAAAGAGLIGPFADAIRTQAPELGYDGVLLAAIGAIVLSLLAIRPLVVHDVPATVAAERTAS